MTSPLSSVDPHVDRTEDNDSVGGLLAEMLAASECRHFFLLTGGDNAFFKELIDRGVSMVLARSERSAAFMADAYARLTGRPSFVYGQFGPGAAVVLSGLIDAFLANTPVIALASETKTSTLYRSSYQELDQQAMYRSVVKWAARIERPDRAPDLLRSALRESVAGCPGPTYLGVPNDVLLLRAGVPKSERYVDTQSLSVPPHRPQAAVEDVEAIAAGVRGAARPLLLAGGGSVISGAFDELVALAELLGIPVVTSAAGKGAIAETHELAMGVVGRYSRRSANAILRTSDTVIAVGTRLNDMTTDSGRAISPTATVLQIDIDAATIGRNWRVGSSAVGDARTVLEQLRDSLAEDGRKLRSTWTDWRESCISMRRDWLAQRELEESHSGTPISPVAVVGALRRTLDANDVVVADTGYMAAWTAALYDVRTAGRSYLRTAGSLGWAFPASLGAQLAVGAHSRVICVTGDGGLGYHLADIETAVRLDLPVVVVVMNNGSLAFEYQVQRKTLGTELLEITDFFDSDYAGAASALGARGERVDDPAEIEPALHRALDSGEPTLLDVRTDRDARAPVTHFELVEERPL